LVFDGDDVVATRTALGAPGARVAVRALDRPDVSPFVRPFGGPFGGAFGGAFGGEDDAAAYHIADGELCAPDGRAFATLADMRRALPHDRTNALAGAAAAFAMGATHAGVRAALGSYETMPHRVALVGEHGGVRYIDDSKATNPHATVHAVAAFDSVVLLAGGRNKGLDLADLARAPERIRAVVAFGEAAPEIRTAFAGVRPVVAVTSMHDAVREGARLAEAGDVVLLSPACASFDAYPNYAARGDDFAREVLALIARSGAGAR
jgi:UDP-N-acetylmuramoylalanine--D-glutamate ligase